MTCEPNSKNDERLDRLPGESVLPAEINQRIHVTSVTPAEAEIAPDYDAAGAQSLNNDLRNEFLRGQRR